VYYWDADAVLISSEGFARLMRAGLVHPQQPGCLKVEIVAPDAEIRGPKNYRIGDERVMAGVRDRTEIDEQGICHDTHFVGLASALAGRPPDGPLTEEVSFSLPQPKISGTVGKSGWVLPERYVEVS
jgi:hypothetical protein